MEALWIALLLTVPLDQVLGWEEGGVQRDWEFDINSTLKSSKMEFSCLLLILEEINSSSIGLGHAKKRSWKVTEGKWQCIEYPTAYDHLGSITTNLKLNTAGWPAWSVWLKALTHAKGGRLCWILNKRAKTLTSVVGPLIAWLIICLKSWLLVTLVS